MLLQNTILQQPSTPPITFRSQKPKCNSYAYGCHRFNVVNTSQALRMPRFLAYTAIYLCQKLGQKLARNEWHCCPVLIHNSWGYTPSLI